MLPSIHQKLINYLNLNVKANIDENKQQEIQKLNQENKNTE